MTTINFSNQRKRNIARGPAAAANGGSTVAGSRRSAPSSAGRAVVHETFEGRRMKPLILFCIISVVYVIFGMSGYLFTLHTLIEDTQLEAQQSTVRSPIAYSTEKAAERDSIFNQENLENSPPFTIFYNVFTGPPDLVDANVTRRVHYIAKEQMGQIGESFAASYKNKPVKLFYNTIGRPGVLNKNAMQQMCAENNIECFHMAHYTDGFEEVTLQRLHEYCHYHDDANDDDDQDRKVIYMHNKGSYHYKEGTNEEWRRHMTRAVTSELCLNPPDDTCSMCGLVFNSMWMMVFPGNFFAARCSYIRKLHPPDTFDQRMKGLLELRHEKIASNPLYERIFPNISDFDFHGRKRFAALHWPGSHPSLVPCDVTDDLGKWFGVRDPSDFKWSLFPRKGPSRLDPIREQQYNIIGGNLLKWYTLYNEGPPDDSWAWRWFPDGEVWRNAMHKFGNTTVDVMVAKGTATLKRSENTTT